MDFIGGTSFLVVEGSFLISFSLASAFKRSGGRDVNAI
jgi:hypothetical protein